MGEQKENTSSNVSREIAPQLKTRLIEAAHELLMNGDSAKVFDETGLAVYRKSDVPSGEKIMQLEIISVDGPEGVVEFVICQKLNS